MSYYAEVRRNSPSGSVQGYVVKRCSDGKVLSHVFKIVYGISEDDEGGVTEEEVYSIEDAERDANIARDSINEAFDAGIHEGKNNG